MHWQLRDRTLSFSGCPRVMGIVNVTPDSFSDGGKFFDPERAVAHALQLLDEGAELLDIGGESTRPGSEPVGVEEELRRVIPVIRGIQSKRPEACLSIDTQKAKVAAAALEAGCSILNDISAGRHDDAMFPVAAESGAGLVLMHMQGKPSTMQENPGYEDVIDEVRSFLHTRSQLAQQQGVDAERIALDPGIGFGKRLADNLDLMRNLDSLFPKEVPLLLGASKKRFLGEVTGRSVDERNAANLATCAQAFFSGVAIIRVHDVKDTCDFLRVLISINQRPHRTLPHPSP